MSVYQRAACVASFCLVLGFSAAACGKKAPAVAPPPPPPATTPTAPPPPPSPPAPPPAATAPRTLTEDEIFSQKSLAQLNNERPLGDVYFEKVTSESFNVNPVTNAVTGGCMGGR